MPTDLYFSRPSNLSFHDLCSTNKPPANIRSLLGLGLNFCIRRDRTAGAVTIDTTRFKRDIYTRTVFAHTSREPPRLFIRSSWRPDVAEIPSELRVRVSHFCQHLQQQVCRRRLASPNLLPLQAATLYQLKNDPTFIVFSTDKNLGPAIIERRVYIQRALSDHLRTDTYRQLTPNEANNRMTAIKRILRNFIAKYPENHDKTFLMRSMQSDDSFAKFYLLAKIHKTPWATRPIVSVSGSLLHGLGRWTDLILQDIVKRLPYVYQSSTSVVERLRKLSRLPTGARLFTMDARSMYTNINTQHALAQITAFLESSPLCSDLSSTIKCGLVAALRIIMCHNVFRFGDTYWLQLKGTAMGTPPAPMYATLYFAIHEMNTIPQFQDNLLEYGRYIDDGFGIWTPSPDASPTSDFERWTEFQTAINSYHPPTEAGLVWDFSDRAETATFLDLTIDIEDHAISTCLYEKALNLYLYLPPHSCHPPGVVKGLIYGRILQIHRLTSKTINQRRQIKSLLSRLCARGYTRQWLLPLFRSALSSVLSRPSTITLQSSTESSDNSLFLHVGYHPSDPPSVTYQRAFESILARPIGATPLPFLRNRVNASLGIDRLTVAYHRPRNLGNYLSPSTLREDPTASVSSLID